MGYFDDLSYVNPFRLNADREFDAMQPQRPQQQPQQMQAPAGLPALSPNGKPYAGFTGGGEYQGDNPAIAAGAAAGGAAQLLQQHLSPAGQEFVQRATSAVANMQPPGTTPAAQGGGMREVASGGGMSPQELLQQRIEQLSQQAPAPAALPSSFGGGFGSDQAMERYGQLQQQSGNALAQALGGYQGLQNEARLKEHGSAQLGIQAMQEDRLRDAQRYAQGPGRADNLMAQLVAQRAASGNPMERWEIEKGRQDLQPAFDPYGGSHGQGTPAATGGRGDRLQGDQQPPAPWAPFASLLDTASHGQGHQLRTPGEFLGQLQASAPPGFLDQNLDKVLPYMSTTFGPSQMDKWFGQPDAVPNWIPSWYGAGGVERAGRTSLRNAMNKRGANVGVNVVNPLTHMLQHPQ